MEYGCGGRRDRFLRAQPASLNRIVRRPSLSVFPPLDEGGTRPVPICGIDHAPTASIFERFYVLVHYSAYIPCFNNAATIRSAVESVLAQSIPPEEVVVVDDGSIDDSLTRLAGLPIRIVRHEGNLGRGRARARAMDEARCEFVLCCDATNVLEPDFAARAAPWLDDRKDAAVFGRIDQRPGRGVAHRWRGDHLFKLSSPMKQPAGPIEGRRFATCGAIVRRSAVLAVGNYDTQLRHSEDADLGQRLAAAGWQVVYDPSLRVLSIAENSVAQVLERYWRWYAGKDERATWLGYWKNIKYSSSVAMRELLAGDLAVAAITVFCPHYCFWRSRRSWKRRFSPVS